MKESSYLLDFAFKSDVGKVRLANEDAAAIVKNKSGDILMLVADGLGGHNKGDFASKTSVKYIKECFEKTKSFASIYIARFWLQHIVTKANKMIFNAGESSSIYKGMGTTLVALLIRRHHICVLNIGDSRAYWLNLDKLQILTEDESLVEYLKRSGQISEDEAKVRTDKNVLMNALGIYPSITYNCRVYRYNNEPILLCSDGLFNNLPENDIKNILSSTDGSFNIASRLVYKANMNGGSDNITAAVFKRSER